ncbi:TetR/AcrR family transcriptional regulator [Fodinicola feengrottensis]|uniref:TetR/AcrR family transcriptional regulator n=1 Tax=Fodinicola feengrottensis TaxID=435914 RepID=UPI0024428C73|nr:TetR/AcrR family transcriptional regulator [Fodinicola feengrottensis]
MERERKAVAVRRDEILAATLDQVRERGIAGTRAAEIAKALGVSTALIFYHFGTIENLVAQAFAAAAEQDLAALDRTLKKTSGGAEKRLRAVLRQYGPTGDAAGWTLWIEAIAAGLRDPILGDVAQRLDLRWRETVADLIVEGVASGEFRCADPRAAAWRLTSLLDGLAVQLVARPGAITRREVTSWLQDCLKAELGI